MFDQIETSKAAPWQGRLSEETSPAGSGIRFYPHCTPFFSRAQHTFSRLTMRLALLLVDAGDALAGFALHLEIGL